MAENTKKITVGIADDHPFTRTGIAVKLTDMEKFKVLYEAGNGKEFIDKIDAAGICPDVCIVDVRMPVMDGYTTTSILKEKYPETKVLALSRHNREFSIIRMLNCGASGYISKEIEPDSFCQAVIGVHNAPYYYNDQISGRLVHRLITGSTKDDGFTETDLEFLSWTCSERTYPEIAKEMNITYRSLQLLRDKLFERLDIHTRHGLVVYTLQNGLPHKT